MERAVSSEAGREKYLNQIIREVCEMLFLIFDAHRTEVVDNLTRMVEKRR